MSLRDRLGGRRAISWQAVVIGDVLIVVLATALAASRATGVSPIDAATDTFAITMAVAVIVALYTALVHATAFRNRERSPIAVPIVVGFHLSIGVLFLVGFAVGAAILSIPPLGGTPLFSIAVLIGGLLVCLPTSLLLDHADRYRTARLTLTERLADLERLRISEWSLRRALRSLVSKVQGDERSDIVLERLDALELSDDTELTTEQWWEASLNHHRSDPVPGTRGQLDGTNVDVKSKLFSKSIRNQVSKDFPAVRWSHQFKLALTTGPEHPGITSVLAAFMTWVFLSALFTSPRALSLAMPIGVGVYLMIRVNSSRAGRTRSSSLVGYAALVVWSLVVVTGWSALVAGSNGSSLGGFLEPLIVTTVAIVSATLVTSWVGSVISARDSQLRVLDQRIHDRQDESAAVLSSLASVVTQMADIPALSGSAAMAACASGVQRVQRESDIVHARRIIDWTESVITSPRDESSFTLQGRIEAVVEPWRALADIQVDCPDLGIDVAAYDDVVAVIDEAVRNACRHGDAQRIAITVTGEPSDRVRIEVVDDGGGLEQGDHHQVDGMGFERFASAASFELVPLDSGTRLIVTFEPRRQAADPSEPSGMG